MAYTNIGKLGAGAFGTTYLIQHIETGEKFAMKNIKAESQSQIKSVKHEFGIMEHMKHPNVVQVHELVIKDGQANIKMEYAPGGDLDGALKKGMSTAQIKMAAVQCLLGLDYLHGKAHVIMRDVKQHNFLLNNGIY